MSDIASLSTGYLSTTRGENSELYTKAAAIIGCSSIQYCSTVAAMHRSSNSGRSHVLLLDTAGGRRYIRAKRILSTIPPSLTNTGSWDLDTTERKLFSQFSNSGYYTAIVNDTGFPPKISVYNADASQPYNLPVLSGIYGISLAAPLPGTSAQPIFGDFSVKYGSQSALSTAAVKAEIISDIQKLQVT